MGGDVIRASDGPNLETRKALKLVSERALLLPFLTLLLSCVNDADALVETSFGQSGI